MLNFPLEVMIHVLQLVDLIDLLRLPAVSRDFKAFFEVNVQELRRNHGIVGLVIWSSKEEFRYMTFSSYNALKVSKMSRVPVIEQLSAVPVGQASYVFGPNHRQLEHGFLTLAKKSRDYLMHHRQFLQRLRSVFSPQMLHTNAHESELLLLADVMPKSLLEVSFDELHLQDGILCCREHSSSRKHLRFLAFARMQPRLRHFTLRFRVPASRSFFGHAVIKNAACMNSPIEEPLKEKIFWSANLTDTALQRVSWRTTNIGISKISSDGLHRFLEDWSRKQREIDYFVAQFMHSFTFEEIVRNLPVDIEILNERQWHVCRHDGAKLTLIRAMAASGVMLLSLQCED